MAKIRALAISLALICALTPAIGGGVARADTGAADTKSTTTTSTTNAPTTTNDNGTAEAAAREIAAARQRANDASDAYWAAQSTLELVGDAKDKLDAEVTALEAKIATLQKTVEAVAVNRYVGSGATGIALLSGNLGPTEQGQTAVLVGIVDEASASSLDDYDALHKELDKKQARANKAKQDLEAAQTDADAKRQAALDEVAHLKVVEKDRLKDEAVQRALEAQRQKDLEAAQKAAAEKLKSDQEAAARAAAPASSIDEGLGSDGGDDGQGAITGNAISGSSSGGTTGGGGTGGRPLGATQVFGLGEDWVCPLQGAPYAFSDTFGAPRSGGRLHQGVDMIAAKGTQIVAVVDGIATAKENVLGGNTVSFVGNDGNRYYYAHMDGYATLGQVVKGTVIGYVGQTGNAIYSTPHLHFEIHPGGGPAVDPTPTVAAHCVQ